MIGLKRFSLACRAGGESLPVCQPGYSLSGSDTWPAWPVGLLLRQRENSSWIICQQITVALFAAVFCQFSSDERAFGKAVDEVTVI